MASAAAPAWSKSASAPSGAKRGDGSIGGGVRRQPTAAAPENLADTWLYAWPWRSDSSRRFKRLVLFLTFKIFDTTGSKRQHRQMWHQHLRSYCWQITVVCISKGERNHQPSSREQAMADYVFCRFFDVGNCTLSDQLPEKIAGQEVNVLLNPKDEQVTSCSDQGVRGMNQKVDEGPIATVPLPQSAVKEDGSPVAAVPLPQPVVKEDENSVAAVPLP